jgi:adenylate cyclase
MLRESALTAGAFTAAVYAYYLVAVWGPQDHLAGGLLRDYLLSPMVHVELLFTGILFGGLIGVVNRVTETPALRNRTLGQVIVLRTLLNLLSFAAVAGLVLLVFLTLLYPLDRMVALFGAMAPRYVISFLGFMAVAVAGINFGLEVERVVGPGNLWGLLWGRYRRAREEERVFLFMDLRGSTPTAERLGHRLYSELLQESYRDLTEVVLGHQASVYQYVGDEVVLTWRCGGRNDPAWDSVRAFFAFRRILAGRADHYRQSFGLVPEFRGGIDQGPVTVIEVGDVKREVVYHGDVLNTAARLLELSKTRGEPLLVSRAIADAVASDPTLRRTWEAEVPLRGKRRSVGVCGLDEAPSEISPSCEDRPGAV